jgi:hypothetical protein
MHNICGAIMNLDEQQKIESSVINETKMRRTFLKRATAGAVIASIPGRSAWAGMAGSIVASGHGSDFDQGTCTQLLSHGYWKNHKSDWPISIYTTFKDVFGGEPISPANHDTGQTLLRVLQKSGKKKGVGLGGPSSVNTHIAAMYLTAAHFAANPSNNSLGIYYPVVQQHGSLGAYATYLYSEASLDPSGVGALLKQTIKTYHVGTSICL